MGKCPQCGSWGSMVERVIQSAPTRKSAPGVPLGDAQPRRLHEISGESEKRIPLPIEEFSRVLGGGIVPGSIVLINGDNPFHSQVVAAEVIVIPRSCSCSM